jgi:ATP-dependent helicase HrpA
MPSIDVPHRPRSMNELKKFCRRHFLSFRRIREWRDIHRQITAALKEQRQRPHGKRRARCLPDLPAAGQAERRLVPPALRCHSPIAILSGFLSNIALKKEKVFFRAAKDREVMLFPGSGLFKNPGNWIVAAEMVETSRLFARNAATIDVAWLEPLGGDLCRATWSDPHWERSREEVVAREQVTLFGLPIVQDRRVAFGRIDPDQASDIFVRSALVDGDVKQPLDFMQYNAERVAAVRSMEDRIRRRDILVDDEVLVAFYKTRLPGVCDMRTLKHRIRKKGGDRFLRLDPKMLIRYAPDPDVLDRFPRQLDLGHRVLACDYAFEPGTEVDGVTVTIPAETTGDVPREQLDWLVPGLLPEKITALIKGLPKAYRIKLVPVADTVQAILDEMPRGWESLPAALSRFLFQRLKVDIPAAAWPVDDPAGPLENAPGHYRRQGQCGGQRAGRPPAGPGAESGPALPSGLSGLKRKWERDDITAWNFGDLPDVLTADGPSGIAVAPLSPAGSCR